MQNLQLYYESILTKDRRTCAVLSVLFVFFAEKSQKKGAFVITLDVDHTHLFMSGSNALMNLKVCSEFALVKRLIR